MSPNELRSDVWKAVINLFLCKVSLWIIFVKSTKNGGKVAINAILKKEILVG